MVDGERNTSWSTETYDGNTLGSKAGVGIYVIAEPAVAARAMQILTPDEGVDRRDLRGQGRARRRRRSTAAGQKLGDIPSAKASQRVDLDTAGNRFRYYLVWITKLPPGANQVADLGDPPVQVGAAKERAGSVRNPARYECDTSL